MSACNSVYQSLLQWEEHEQNVCVPQETVTVGIFFVMMKDEAKQKGKKNNFREWWQERENKKEIHVTLSSMNTPLTMIIPFFYISSSQ
jgi:hypothetical protein